MRRVLLALVVVVAACSGGSKVSIGKAAPPLRGPEITRSGLSGGSRGIDDFKGQPVIVNFWASWCGPCRQEMPRIQALFDRGVAVLGVDVAEGPNAARLFLMEFGVSWPSIHDPDEKAATGWSVGRGLPQTFSVSADGVIRGRHFGLASDADLAELVRVAG